jgi:signal transduction histidine kinase/streptogramin lyase
MGLVRRSLVAACVVHTIAMQAQLVAPPIRQLDGKDGLSEGRVWDMEMDPLGYLWIATSNGLGRFDGVQVKVYRNGRNGRSLPSDLVTNVALGSGRYLYVGTGAPYLTIIDVLADTLVNVPLPTAACAGSKAQTVNDILIDGRQRTWVAHGARCLSRFDLRTATFTTTAVPPPMPTPPSREMVSSIHEDGDGILWLCMFKGLVRFDPATGVQAPMDLHPAPGQRFRAEGFQLAGMVDEDSALVFGTWGEGIFRMRKRDGALKLLWPEPGHVPTYVDHAVTELVRISPTKAMVACVDMGLLQLDLPTGRVEHFNRSLAERDCRKLEDTFVGCGRAKKFGDLLVLGSNNGEVALISLKEPLVRAFSLPLHDPDEINDGVIAVVDDPGGNGMIAISGRRGAFLLDSTGALLRHTGIPYDAWEVLVDLQRLGPDRWLIGALKQARTISFGSGRDFQSLRGTMAACGQQLRWVRPAAGPGLWCMCRGEGIAYLDTLAGTCTPLRDKWPAVARELSTVPLDVFLDRQGRSWFLSADKPPVVLHPDGRVQRVEGPASLAPFEVSDIAQTPDGRIWLVAIHAGLALVAPDGPIEPADVSDRMPTRNVTELVAMADNTLWLDGPGGLLHWDPATHEGRILGYLDGIRSHALSLYPSHETLHYPLVVGAPEGFYMISDPGASDADPVQVQLPEVLCMDTLVRRHAQNTREPLVLPHSAKRVSVLLRVNDLLQPQRSELAYRLVGQAEGWTNVGSNERITFNNLPQGSYRFEARACRAGEAWGPVASMQLTLLPPWWATWWFRTVAVLLLVLAGWAAVRTLVRLKLRKQRRIMDREHAKLQERIRIAHDLHDDLGSGLASIRMESAMAGMGVAEKAAHDALMRVSETARNVSDDLRRIIWAMGSGQESLGDLLAYVRSHAAELLDRAGIDLQFDTRVQDPERHLGMDQRKHLVLFTKEALHNVVKHADARQVELRITSTDARLHWCISDDGKGFDPDGSDRYGTGNASMAKRAKELGASLQITTAPGQGTRLELVMPW